MTKFWRHIQFEYAAKLVLEFYSTIRNRAGENTRYSDDEYAMHFYLTRLLKSLIIQQVKKN